MPGARPRSRALEASARHACPRTPAVGESRGDHADGLDAPEAGRTDGRALAEIDRLWQGEASGARSRCRSPFGVYDMTGNVDEWTVSVRPGERPSILKGGYWGPVRTRCRPSTRAHGEDYASYQQGFRCCADVPSRAAGR
jgi:formylglycine-generating enzyme required for sulfatase activity